ncbi:carbohydrate sulfotransferase 1-like isoform X2 [Mercenaria mercenaria]|uniref:carbohydrate sulfotransferase 1-like isoform X2 n=1 Tax=Mercenaria mercenaria TaxID=6596 RepID=UPI00234E632D|nr:carbohydrate sulfotransferase 1-like isoform X2 [Mercenaria mercenaria]
METRSVDSKILTGNVITARKTLRNTCVILVAIATLYACLTIRIKSGFNVGDVLPPAPVETVHNRTTAFRKNRSQMVLNRNEVSSSSYPYANNIQSKDSINTHRNDPYADSMETREKENGTYNFYAQKDKTALDDTEESTQKKQNVHSNKKIVLIVAYMRSGSTLTGSLFQAYPGTFYVFEPLRFLVGAFNGLARNNKTYTTLKYANGTNRNYSASQKSKVIFDELNSWLNCKIESISIRSLTNIHHREHTKVMRTFYYCTKGRLGSSVTQANAKLKQCFKTAVSSCENAPLRAIKLIRMSIEEASKLLPLYPNMKIIHLVRDPRGIMNSRFKINEVTKKSFKKSVEGHCSSVDKDLKSSKEILQKFPNRLKIVHYEDLAERPIEIARALIKFAELPFVKAMQTFTRQQTHASRDSGAFSTQRKNSTKTANKWRWQMDPENAGFIFNMCNASNSVLGYLP